MFLPCSSLGVSYPLLGSCCAPRPPCTWPWSWPIAMDPLGQRACAPSSLTPSVPHWPSLLPLDLTAPSYPLTLRFNNVLLFDLASHSRRARGTPHRALLCNASSTAAARFALLCSLIPSLAAPSLTPWPPGLLALRPGACWAASRGCRGSPRPSGLPLDLTVPPDPLDLRPGTCWAAVPPDWGPLQPADP